jgi:hypothetical protein
MHTKILYEPKPGLYMGLDTPVQEFVESLKDLNQHIISFSEECPNQIDQHENFDLLFQVNGSDPMWHETIVNINIDIIKRSYEESVS